MAVQDCSTLLNNGETPPRVVRTCGWQIVQMCGNVVQYLRCALVEFSVGLPMVIVVTIVAKHGASSASANSGPSWWQRMWFPGSLLTRHPAWRAASSAAP